MKFGLCLSAQYLPGDSPVERWREHIEQVQVAEESGFDSIWASHHYTASLLATLPSASTRSSAIATSLA